MCGRYGRISRQERIAELIGGALHDETGELDARFDVAPGTFEPVIRATQGRPVLSSLRWG